MSTSPTYSASQNIEMWPIERLNPYARNPRKNDAAVDRMVASIQEFGFKIPCLVRSSGEVVDGHLRLKAAHKLGITEIPVILCDEWSEAQVKAFRLMVNRSVTWAEWDEEALGSELRDLKTLDYDLSLTGFEDEELIQLLAAQDATLEGLTDEDDAPAVPNTAATRLGDLWLMGPHRLKCGNSTNVDEVVTVCNGTAVDLLLTDPPYNVSYVGKTRDALKIQNDSMTDEAFRQFLRDAVMAADTVMKPGAVFYIWHADSEGYNFRGACVDAGWTVRQVLVWKKQTLVMGRQDYHWLHEPCLYGWKDGAGHLWASDRKQTTVLEFDRPARSAEHPTMKPVALFEYQLLNNTKPGDIVLDLFGGSGTTMIAAEKNGRTAYLMELDPKYCDVIIQRWQNFSGKRATLDGDGRTFDEIARERSKEVA